MLSYADPRVLTWLLPPLLPLPDGEQREHFFLRLAFRAPARVVKVVSYLEVYLLFHCIYNVDDFLGGSTRVYLGATSSAFTSQMESVESIFFYRLAF